MSHLPPQQNAADTYYAIPAVRWTIEHNDPSQLEDATGFIWTNVLSALYPPQQGYVLCPNFRVPGGQGDILTVRLVAGPNPLPQKFFVVEFKRTSLESQDAVWRDALAQLKDYLDCVHNRAHNHNSLAYRVFGAVAVGRYVRFYEYERPGGTLTALPIGNQTLFHVGRECLYVHRILVMIKSAR